MKHDITRHVLHGIIHGMVVVFMLAVGAAPASAATYWWDGTGTSWATLSNWSTASNATTPDPSVLSGTTDSVIFNINGVTTAQTLTLDGNAVAQKVTFASSGGVTINQGTSGTLSVGNGGLAVTSGSVRINAPLSFVAALGGSNPLTVSSSTSLTLAGMVTGTTTGIAQQTTFDINASGGRVIISSSSATLGYLLLRDGTMSLDASVASAPSLTLASTSDAFKVNRNGKFVMSAGTLNVAGNWLNGDASSGGSSVVSGGTINHTGGSVNVGTNGGSQGYFGLSGTAVYNGSGRSLNMANQGESRAFFSVKDTVSATLGNVTLGANAGAGTYSSGIIEISGGSLTTGTAWIGKSQNSATGVTLGTVNQWGGLMTVNGPLVLAEYNQAAGSPTTALQGTYNLQSGTLVVQQILGGTTAGGVGGQARLNLRGGTLAVNSSASTTQKSNFINLTGNSTDGQVYVYEGGTIDTGAESITIAQPLLAATGSGVTAITISGNGSGFMTPPSVIITPAAGDTTGRGATATATMNANGTITGIQITSPGTGYTAVPTISFRSVNNAGSWPMDVGYTLTGSATIGSNSAYSGGITKNGSGELMLSGNNTFTGGVTINNGRLTVGHANALGTGTARVSGGELNIGVYNPSVAGFRLTSGSLTGSGVLTSTSNYDVQAGSVLARLGGSVGLTKSTDGTVMLSGSNTYTGATLVTAGTLSLGTPYAISGSSAITLGSGSTQGVLSLGNHALTTASLTFTGSGGILPEAAGRLTLQGLSGSSALISVAATSAGTIHPNIAFDSPTELSVETGGSLLLHTAFSGTGSLTKSGAGLLDIYGNNDGYSGSFAINSGTVRLLGGMSQLGIGTTTVNAGGTLDMNSRPFSGTYVLNGGSLVNILSGSGSGNVEIAGTSTISGTAATNAVFTVKSTGNATFDQAIGNAYITVKAAGGRATFNQAFTGSTSTVIVEHGAFGTFAGNAAGMFDIHGTGTFGGSLLSHAMVNVDGSARFTAPLAVNSTVEVFGGGVATFSGTVAGKVTVSGSGGNSLATFSNRITADGAVNILAGGTATFLDGAQYDAADIENAGSLVFNNNMGLTVAATIDGIGSLLKSGSGTLTLNGANGFTGLTTISGGTLLVGNGGVSGSLAGNVLNNAALAFNRSDVTTYAGSISGSGLVRLLGGSLTLSGSSSYSGGTWVDGGTLKAGNVNAFGTNGITLGSGATLDLTGFTVANTITNNGGTILGGVLSGTMTATNDTTIDSDLGEGASLIVGNGKTVTFGDGATVNSNASINTSNSGTVRINRTTNTPWHFDGVVTGSGGFTVDRGHVKLSGSQAYSGLTQVTGSASILAVNGSVAGSVQVDSGAELGGSGMIAGDIGGDGLIGPGNSPGILTVQGQINPTSSTSFAFEFMKTGDPIWSTGTGSMNDVLRLQSADPFVTSLTASNVVNVYLEVTSLASGNTFRGGFFSDFSSQSLNFANEIGAPTYQYFVLGDGKGGVAYNTKNYYTLADYLTNNPGTGITEITASVVSVPSANFSGGTITNGQVTQFVIVPEPSTVIFAGIGIAMAGWSLWKRRRIAHILRRHAP